jgi:hypothetical protein
MGRALLISFGSTFSSWQFQRKASSIFCTGTRLEVNGLAQQGIPLTREDEASSAATCPGCEKKSAMTLAQARVSGVL